MVRLNLLFEVKKNYHFDKIIPKGFAVLLSLNHHEEKFNK